MEPVTTVLGFLNTVDVEEGTDLMRDLDEWRTWVSQAFGLDPDAETDDSRRHALALRDHLREIAAGEEPGDVPAVDVTVELRPAGAVLAPTTVIGHVAAATMRLSIEDRWARIKICPADDCRWAFYDESKNRSRQWCSMQVCGNRAKARAHRERVTR